MRYAQIGPVAAVICVSAAPNGVRKKGGTAEVLPFVLCDGRFLFIFGHNLHMDKYGGTNHE